MFWLLFTALFFSNPDSEKPTCFLENSIQGTLLQTHVSVGGMVDYHEPQQPAPLGNHTLYVVRYEDEKTMPVVVQSITSDMNGNFSVSLPYGKYGFVETADTAALNHGQWKPNEIHTSDEYQLITYDCTWEFSFDAPVNLIGKDVSGLVLTRHEVSICGVCP